MSASQSITHQTHTYVHTYAYRLIEPIVQAYTDSKNCNIVFVQQHIVRVNHRCVNLNKKKIKKKPVQIGQ